jgi:hypothetical protein
MVETGTNQAHLLSARVTIFSFLLDIFDSKLIKSLSENARIMRGQLG